MSLQTRALTSFELQFNMIERGTIMIFTLAILVSLFNIGIQFCRGTLDDNLLKEDKGESKERPNQPIGMQSGDDIRKDTKMSGISVNKIGMVSMSGIKQKKAE